MEVRFKTTTPEETGRLGENLGKCLSGACTILLMGGMGAGKTAITRGIVKGMGLSDDVSSPTYTLVNKYDTGDKTVYHFDLYRLVDGEELYEMGFEDYLDEGATLIIEWPQLAEDYPFQSLVTLLIEQPETDFMSREISIKTEDEARAEDLRKLVE